LTFDGEVHRQKFETHRKKDHDDAFLAVGDQRTSQSGKGTKQAHCRTAEELSPAAVLRVTICHGLEIGFEEKKTNKTAPISAC